MDSVSKKRSLHSEKPNEWVRRSHQERLAAVEDIRMTGPESAHVKQAFPRILRIAVNRDNAAKILATISDLGFQSLSLKQEDFLEEDTVVEIGREPIKIRIPTGIDGVTFESCSRDRLLVTLEGRRMPFIGFESLLEYKAASPRAKDRIDLAELRKIEGIGRTNDRGQQPEL